ncbi:MAG: molecular chaperone HtpG [Candidatus Thiodiazotropha weberae]|uniref:Chaperone protein HtpG n=1 Tax=Candidatus Thiodiazotropha endoloripes TaxID=1818881 RepID=A0A1E2UTU2_9GAMM|nr:molecular chaperone HtpG [Candidatus Thiodiazotropha endoloripes]MCG7897329.1 molecular chaperone HtpG [Candidatus Thiodiazotropha weberae]MCG7902764.1 molecular chaperone HtpG [Candidatus Thiodiazotropha weberae]MCG7914706.1 molecular chaperone HtpG [Candidatus Thiodiazotropha weberae]ODB82328.1 molecular chaperone HtpG [Candidatus Thiodiazotropha endoloripes]ODB87012.1 molecular chaperone HtpG [Candidatus Thiodiazotropha endoloripes]
MTVEAQKETLDFQAEVSQVLNLVIRSLYSNKEIFLRELISNASDAAEKLRFEALTDEALFEEDPELKVRVTYDKEAGTLTISDNGIGMSRQDVTETIGTIASSGTRKFFEAMSGDQAKDSELIGQFGVGFYSAFIVADKVTLKTRRAGLGHEHGVQWVSEGQGSYSIENIDKPSRGTDVILHLREDENEFLEGFRLRNIISKFSDHITMPVEMEKEFYGEDEEKPETAEYERVNTGTALWMRSRSEISDEEYNEFYKHVSHDFEDPLLHVHNRVEGNNEYTALLFVPARAPFDLWDRDQKHGVKLFVRRVFIMDEAEKLMPRYMRFVKGVVDSDDLPLNVSREILQHNRKIDTIRQANVKRVLGALEKLAENDKEKYQEFWDQFGKVLKEGPAEDFANKEKISALLRFASTHNEQDEQTVSLADYVARMREGQDKIYYITADSAAAARFSPHLEVLKKKGIEVLLLSDRVDEWLVTSLTEFDGKSLQSVAKGELDLGELEDKEEQESQEQQAEEHKALLDRMQQVLQESVKEIRISQRLTDSPACLVVEEHDMSANLARVLKSVGQDAPQTKPIMEVNATHPLVVQLENEADEERFGDLSKVLFDQAQLAEGGQLDDPAAFVRRLNSLMLKLAGQ